MALTSAQKQTLATFIANNAVWAAMPKNSDTFYTFSQEKSFTVRDPERNDHRTYWSHAPVLWMLVGLVIFITSKEQYWQVWGILFWLGSWSHFLLDSIS